MFIKQVANRVLVYNEDLKVVLEYNDSKMKINENRINVISQDGKCVCDMPIENTTILYR